MVGGERVIPPGSWGGHCGGNRFRLLCSELAVVCREAICRTV